MLNMDYIEQRLKAKGKSLYWLSKATNSSTNFAYTLRKNPNTTISSLVAIARALEEEDLWKLIKTD